MPQGVVPLRPQGWSSRGLTLVSAVPRGWCSSCSTS